MTTVLPGDPLAREEEFEAGPFSFADEDGNIRARVMGRARLDNRFHSADVEPRRVKLPLEVGAIVLGRVVMIKPSACVIEMFQGTKNGQPLVMSGVWASIPVHKIARQYVRSVRDCFRIGDIVRARVTLVVPFGVDVTTAEPGLGVVQAYCSRCRASMHLFGTHWKCTKCGSDEIRKLAMMPNAPGASNTHASSEDSP